jgi:hypothetical protein
VFPFNIAREIEVGGMFDVPLAIDRLERGLQDLRAKQICRGARDIQFKGSVLRENTNLLQPISCGHLLVEQSQSGLQVTCRLEFYTLLLLVSALVLGFAAPILLLWSNAGIVETCGILSLAWVWLYGGNVLATMWRFPRWVSRTCRGSRR